GTKVGARHVRGANARDNDCRCLSPGWVGGEPHASPRKFSLGWSTGASSPSLTIRGRREPPTTMMTRMKKTRKTRTGTKNRQSSENPTNSAAHTLSVKLELACVFARLVWAVLAV